MSTILRALQAARKGRNRIPNIGFSDCSAALSGEQRVMIISICFLVGVALKNALSHAYGVLSLWLNTTMSHRIRSGILDEVLNLSQLYLDSQASGEAH